MAAVEKKMEMGGSEGKKAPQYAGNLSFALGLAVSPVGTGGGRTQMPRAVEDGAPQGSVRYRTGAWRRPEGGWADGRVPCLVQCI